jgi:hypothetical protein
VRKVDSVLRLAIIVHFVGRAPLQSGDVEFKGLPELRTLEENL